MRSEDTYTIRLASEGVGDAVDRLAVTSVDWADREQAERDGAIRAVVVAGRSLLEAIAKDDESVAKFRDGLRGKLALTVMTDAHIPLEWIYLGDPARPDIRQFLGFSRVVCYSTERPSPQEVKRGKHWNRFNRVPSGASILVNFAEDLRLRSAKCRSERRVFDLPLCDVRELPPLGHGNGASIGTFHHFMGSAYHLAHFNSHGEPQSRKARARLTVTESFPIDASAIDRKHFRSEGSSVFLNSCDGLALDYGEKRSLAVRFAYTGATQVVATTSKIEDSYATDFARLFYGRYLTGATAGVALFVARREIMKRTGNPAALSYGLVGDFGAGLVDAAEAA